MPYQVKQLIAGKGAPVCVKKDDLVSKALSLMIEYDYSQLPVITTIQGIDEIEGMITYEGILRGVRNFKAKIEDLYVQDVVVSAPIFNEEDDLFDILDKLKDSNAVLVLSSHIPELIGIVTSYDTTEYFRNRNEDLMRVEDIELMVKEFIKTAYSKENGETDEIKLQKAIGRVTPPEGKIPGAVEKEKKFEDLTLSEYISILIMNDTWPFFEPVFHVHRDFVKELMYGIRDIRNALAHFRGDILPEERDKLKFGAEWLSRRQEEYQKWKEEQRIRKALENYNQLSGVETVLQPSDSHATQTSDIPVIEFTPSESSTSGSRYAALADWLQSQPGQIDQVQLTLNQIEEIIKTDLPPSARSHRGWWANDSVGHSHSQLWLDAGWRTTYIYLSEGKVTFSRIREREKAYIAFFSSLLNELRKKANFTIKDVSPDGASWIVIQPVSSSGPVYGYFTYSFSREKRFRVELYLDLYDQAKTKAVFDKLYVQREQIETRLGEVTWERLDNKRASRIAMYHPGHITDEKKHTELQEWAVDSMIKFYDALREPAEKAIYEVMNG